MDGNIIDIKRFSIHDGPGIRSTVFLKGCPLRCVWCQNPEGIEKRINLWYFENKCIKCDQCIDSCAYCALTAQNVHPHILIDRERCVNSGRCVQTCPTKSLCFDGKTVSHNNVVKELLKDKLFYDQSGGGITLSGGEPLYQPEFSLEILRTCKKYNVHTVIETCLFYQTETLKRFLEYVDLFYVDLKLFDIDEHKKYIGVDNNLIKDNYKYLASQNKAVIVRIPLIPGITATKYNVKKISAFVYDINRNIPIELMNYNPLAENKYRIMGKNYDVIKGMKPFADSDLDEFYKIVKTTGASIIQEAKRYLGGFNNDKGFY